LNGGPVELSNVFYNRGFRTILGFCIYWYENGNYYKKYVDIISSVLTHDHIFVKNAIDKLYKELPFLNDFQETDYFLDCGPHFRNKDVLYYLLFDRKQNNITVHFFSEKHGKSPIDSHFSLLSRWLQLLEKERHINTTDELIEGFNLKINECKELQKITETSREKKQKAKENKKEKKRPSKSTKKVVEASLIEKEDKNKAISDIKFIILSEEEYIKPEVSNGLKIKNLQCFYSFKRSSNNGNITVQGSTSSISSEGSLSKYHDMMHEIVEEIINEKKS